MLYLHLIQKRLWKGIRSPSRQEDALIVAGKASRSSRPPATVLAIKKRERSNDQRDQRGILHASTISFTVSFFVFPSLISSIAFFAICPLISTGIYAFYHKQLNHFICIGGKRIASSNYSLLPHITDIRYTHIRHCHKRIGGSSGFMSLRHGGPASKSYDEGGGPYEWL